MNDEQKIIRTILDLANSKEKIIIGIDGLGGAGKSTISEKICNELEKNNIHTILLHIDDFINVRNVRYDPEYPEWQCYYELQWRYGYFTDIIGKIKDTVKSSVEVELYDKDNDCYIKSNYTVKPKTVIITEGVFLQRKELQGIFDRIIYIDIPENIRLTRVLNRDTYIGNGQQIIQKYENRYFPAEHIYVDEYQPASTADIVIGMDF